MGAMVGRGEFSPGEEFLAGINAAPPEVQAQIWHQARWKSGRTPSPVVVEPTDFMSRDEVKRVLHRRVNPGTDYRRLATAGLLRDAYRTSDGASGFTRGSVERELSWRQQVTRQARIRRGIRILLGPVVGWWHYPPEG